MKMKGFPDLPPLWWLGSIVLIYLGEWVLPSVHITLGVLTALSWVVFLSAIAVIAWSGLWFLKKKTPIEPHHTPKTLIIEGPYRLSRNPIYLALVMMTVAFALEAGSVIGLAVAAGLWWILDRRFAGPEETLLRATFGKEAEGYLSRTKRWM
jgi:protein-S-isoprenylcysteine O-methyltransferase Ste14